MKTLVSAGRRVALLALLAAAPLLAQAQTPTPGVGIGTTAPDASAALDIVSSSKGLLLPRLTQDQRNAIASPAAGLAVYNTTTNKLNTWNGTSWTETLTTTEQPTQYPAMSFAYTGGAQTYVVPLEVYSLTIDARGAQGGTSGNGYNGPGGLGGRIKATVPVTPGETLTVYVGGVGTTAGNAGGGAGYNGGGKGYRFGGGGGGATDVRRGAATFADRLLTAAGGGGGAGLPSPNSGGSGGYPNGSDGDNSNYGPGSGGGGATQTGPGSGGAPVGSAGQGGSTVTGLSGGGGGGYYGGGGGHNGGGGGGSSWVTPTGSVLVLAESGTVSGPGSVTLTPGPSYAAPVLNGKNIVSVPGTWGVNGTSYYYNNGSVGIGTATPAASAALEVSSTSKGLLPPRLTLAQREALPSPATGLTIYNTSSNALNTWNGTSWTETINSATQPAVQNLATTFAYTGGSQTYTVPAGVYSLGVSASGAQGGGHSDGTPGGLGGRVVTTLAVTPGETLTLYVGGQGTTVAIRGNAGAGYNGGGLGTTLCGGGGGATDLRRSTTVPSTNLADRLVVAGGGGGAVSSYVAGTGGAGGGVSGGAGSGVTPGLGGTQTGGGAGYGAGSLGQGGNGVYAGGGGGYYGGGGGRDGGAGGGSGYAAVPGTSATTLTAGVQSGDGSLTLTPGPVYAAPAISGVNIVGVPGDNLGNHTATQNLNLAAYQLVGGGGSQGLSISSAGNVGIGTSSPSQKLDVAGNAAVAGNATVSGLLTAGSATVSGATIVSGPATFTGTTAINSTGTASTTLGSATGAVILPGLSTAGLVTNSASGQLGTATAASLGASFVLNQSSPQANASFNVAGTGTVGGKLGIGTTTAAPATQALDVRGNVRLGDDGGSSATGTGQAIEFVGPGVNTDPVGLYRVNPASDQSELRVVVGDAADANDKFMVGRTSASGEGGIPGGTFTPSFTVRSDGNVGIGTATPGQKLDVNGSANVSGNATVGGNATVSGSVGIGTTSPTQVLDVSGGILARSNGLIGNQGAHLQWNRSGGAGETWLLNQNGGGGGGIRFGQSNSVTTGSNTIAEWARFESNGNFGIGTTSPAAALQVNGTALVGSGSPPTTVNATGIGWNAVNAGLGESEFYNYRGSGSGGFRFFVVGGTGAPSSSSYVGFINPTTGAYSSISDRRAKTNIAALGYGLRAVLALRPVAYDLHPGRQLKDGVVTFLPTDQPVRSLGFVAQDLLQVVPEAVEKPADERKEFYTVSYATLVPVLTQAIQEQQAQIEALKAENAALRTQAATNKAQATAALETFEARLRRLEAAGEGQARR